MISWHEYIENVVKIYFIYLNYDIINKTIGRT